MNIIPGAAGSFLKNIRLLPRPSDPDATNKLLRLLTRVLPAFASVAMFENDGGCIWSDLDDKEDKRSSETRQFLQDFNIKVTQLYLAIECFDADLPSNTADLDFVLLRVVDMLERSFVPTSAEAELHCRVLGLEKNPSENFPKLSALSRVLPENGAMLYDEEKIVALSHILSLQSGSLSKYGKKLLVLDDAFSMLHQMQQSVHSLSDCPLRVRDYPAYYLHEASETLFSVLQKRWRCVCDSPLHLNRPLKLNLTQHQRFDMEPRRDCKLPPVDQTQFRLLFPTSLGALQWQHADVAIKNKKVDDASEIQENLCHLINKAKSNIIPKMSVFDKRLWQNRYYSGDDTILKIPNGEFETLEQLLEPSFGNGPSQISAIRMRDRIGLSFILATSFFHMFNITDSWMQARMTSSNICFRTCTRDLDIMKPFLNMSFPEQKEKSKTPGLEDIHWMPNILSLGILLLEICRGRKLEVQPGDDACFAAIDVFEKWKALRGKTCSGDIPEECFLSILACLSPNELRKGNLHKKNIAEADVRGYVFKQILYPLGYALSKKYGVELEQIVEDTSSSDLDEKDLGSIESDKRQASKLWRRNLEAVHAVFYHHRFKPILQLDKMAAAVRIAVLDTGFQLDEALQANYIDAGRIVSASCKTFCSPEYDASDWNDDTDGHGTYVGQIVLDVAPTAELYVAKVCRSRKDFDSPTWATTVQQNIADAIIYAAETWNVDMIIMSFGFERKIRVIGDALTYARKVVKPPLIFAATRNEGAHKGIAWPASDTGVFGISSTDGHGAPSSFNPADKGSDTILYAFGEGVKVKPPAGNPKLKLQTYVSGTSFATPTAAALAANLLGFVRLAILACSEEDQYLYCQLPDDIMEMNGMLTVLKKWMMKPHQSRQESLLPWEFLNTAGVEGNTILNLIYKAI